MRENGHILLKSETITSNETDSDKLTLYLVL